MSDDYRTRDCTLENMRYDIAVYGSTSVNEAGEVNEDEAICNLSDALREWQGEDEPYYCGGCDMHFRRWESAQAHLEGKVQEALT